MLELLEHDMGTSATDLSCHAIHYPYFITILDGLFQCWDACSHNLPDWIDSVGKDLYSGRLDTLVLIFNLGGVHWVGLIVSFVDMNIRYADPKDAPISVHLVSLMTWW